MKTDTKQAMEETIKVLKDTIKIIERQAKISPYWQLNQEIKISLTIGDINRLYYVIELLESEID
jgi:hypothetical protein